MGRWQEFIISTRQTWAITFPRVLDSPENPEAVLVDKQEKLKLMRLLRTAIPRMTKRERHILRRRFLGTKQTSRNKIGRELGVSKERVRQLEIRALDKLRSIAAVSQTAE